nr:hypothetical protein CVNMHQAP_CVNMHQAP_CDS_0150 [uncultured phage]
MISITLNLSILSLSMVILILSSFIELLLTKVKRFLLQRLLLSMKVLHNLHKRKFR